MPILTVELTDTFDQWRQKDNEMITKVNSLSAAGDIISTTSPAAGQILVFDGTYFRNVTASGDINISSTGVVSVIGGGTGNSRGRTRFIGSMSSLY